MTEWFHSNKAGPLSVTYGKNYTSYMIYYFIIIILHAMQWKYWMFLDLRQKKNDSIWSKNQLGSKLPRFSSSYSVNEKARQIQI